MMGIDLDAVFGPFMELIPVDLEIAPEVSVDALPTKELFKLWVQAVLDELDHDKLVTVAIRVMGEDESRKLNLEYRGKDKPTNVLSFPLAAEGPIPLLGDLAICAPVVEAEAVAQDKSSEAHWAHMVVHGTLHLLGYDHEQNDEAEQMEALEVEILKKLGIADPY